MSALRGSRVDGKKALVTGAGRGLGEAISLLLASEGAEVVCQDLDATSAQATADAIVEAGGRAIAFGCDVSDSAAIDEMFGKLDAEFGVVDVFVSNAGVSHTPGDASVQGAGTPEQISLMSDDGWWRMLQIHLGGTFYCTRAMTKRLFERSQPGSIIGISSLGAWGGAPPHYAAAKAGILGLMASIARMCGPLGIRANAVCPGVIDTPMSRAHPREALDAMVTMTPLQRVGEPNDIAYAVLYFASDESRFVTGQVISPNGGLEIMR